MAIENNNFNEAELDELIAKYLQGELSEEERSRLDAWVSERPENKVLYNRTLKAWQLLLRTEQNIEVNTAAAFKKVKARTIEVEPKVVKLWQRPLWAAAAIVALITLGYLFKLINKQEPVVTTLTTTQAKEKFYLPDSSEVWLKKNSTLHYSSEYEGEERKVQLDGEAFFEVRKNHGKKFLVMGNQSVTQVLGTSFNVQSYKGKGTDRVQVVTGKVSFNAVNKNTEGVVLTPGQEGELDSVGNASKHEIDDPNFRAWLQNKLEFDNTDLKTVIATLHNYFGTEILVNDPSLLNCRFTATFDKPDLEQIVKVLAVSINLSYKKERGNYVLGGEGCARK